MKADEASSTAYTMFQGIVYSGRYSEDRSHVPPALLHSNEFILQSSRAGRKLGAFRSSFYRLLLKAVSDNLPGMAFHYVLKSVCRKMCSSGH